MVEEGIPQCTAPHRLCDRLTSYLAPCFTQTWTESVLFLQTSHLKLQPNPAYGADAPPDGCHIPTDFLIK